MATKKSQLWCKISKFINDNNVLHNGDFTSINKIQ